MNDYVNNTLVKSSWDHFPHAGSNVNTLWSDGCKLVCVCVGVCDVSIEEFVQSGVRTARTL